MPKHAKYRWRGWRTDLGGGTITSHPKRKTKRGEVVERGITPAQARYLAKLQRRAGEPYSGRGLTVAKASSEIYRVQQKLGKR